jgi:hypothetical protein
MRPNASAGTPACMFELSTTFFYYNGNASQLHPKMTFTFTVEDSELGRLCNSMECDATVTESLCHASWWYERSI